MNHKHLEDSIIVHGLWPEYKNCPLEYCLNPYIHFGLFPKNLKEELDRNWISTDLQQYTNEGFLTYQYNKHGNCWRSEMPKDVHKTNHEILQLLKEFEIENLKDSEKLEEEKNQEEKKNRKATQYFRLALKLKQTIGIEKILAAKSIIQSDHHQYEARDIIQTITDTLGTQRFSILCASKEGKTYLTEIKICLNKDYSVINCSEKVIKGHDLINYSSEVKPIAQSSDKGIWRRKDAKEIDFF